MATMLDLMERELGLERDARARARERRRRPARDADRQRRQGRARRPPRRRDQVGIRPWPTSSSCRTSAKASPRARSRAGSSRRARRSPRTIRSSRSRPTRRRSRSRHRPPASSRKILVAEGEVVPVGTVLVVIGGNGAEPRGAETGTSQPGTAEKVRATPLVRRLAEELGVDLATITGTGPQGRITEDDVRGERRRAARGPARADPRDQAADVRAPRRARTARSRRSPGSRSATSPTST